MGFGASRALSGAQDFFENFQAVELNREAERVAASALDQSNLVFQEFLAEANRTRRENRLFRESQAQTFNSSGISLPGSATPLAILNDTAREGDKVVQSIERAGIARRDAFRSEGEKAIRFGQNALFGVKASQGFRRIEKQVKREQQLAGLLTGGLTALAVPLLGQVGSSAGSAIGKRLFGAGGPKP